MRKVALALVALSITASTAQAQPPGSRPRSGRPRGSFKPPAILEVTGAKVLALNPIAELLDQENKLDLSREQRAELDSLNTALDREIAPFIARIDSLKPRTGEMSRRPEGGRRREPGAERRPGAEGGGGPMLERWEPLQLTIGMVKLRYEAALLSAERIVGDERRERLAKVVAKGLAKMEEYTAPFGPRR